MKRDKYQITFETWNKIASIYQEKFMDLDLYDDTYDRFCEGLKTINPAILEIGCGPGNITRYLLSKRPDLNIEAIDIAPNMIELAKKNVPNAIFKVMDCRDIHQLTTKYHGIICGFCLPYLSKDDVEKLVKDCSSLLKKDGILYLSTIEGNYEQSGFEAGSTGDKAFVYYHQKEFLEQLLLKHDLELTDVFEKAFQRSEVLTQTHLVLIAKSKI